ncbi:phenylalanine--tRNA ligase subunit alpha [Henriciella barbarensis]|uniref:Phenylalanine--tRNA ligase alpha subunit n=1 Tax=Henriciella barbarensis TaxID=86342 RepID=A0A399QZM8_9PROT|nr:phenylalanine--tRNA ligase subunit alpha [Henriciella barbarensis]RIJ23674.1 phenylalanine--tRNA ligase subunit alpha [Henriciella barbarensis]
MSDTDKIETEALGAIEAANDLAALDAVRVAELGKKGRISGLMKTLGGMSPEERQDMGPKLNGLRNRVADAVEARKATLEDAELEKKLQTERIDMTLPPLTTPEGKLHPVMQVFEEIAAIFGDMGFSVAEGPDIEDDWHNFTALNFPEGHPARETHDTFFFDPQEGAAPKVLRTHTSPVQVRVMEAQKPPIRILVPGRVYRNDWDATHTPMFHQVEGLVIEKNIHMGHLKGCLIDFVREFFEVDNVEARFRPHFFPFTEPSAEMDVKYTKVGDSIEIGAGDSWMEILGSGMVHPNVLRNCGIDPNEYQGFAFGMGVDRLAMLKYGMPDLRPYFEADAGWSRHYGFRPWATPSVSGGLS